MLNRMPFNFTRWRFATISPALVVSAAGLLLSTCSPCPLPAQARAPKQGAEVFASAGCAHCHGDQGQGTDDGPALRSLRKRLSAARIRSQIVHGGKEMPAFGDSLTPLQVNDLVAFLRAKTWIPAPGPAPAPTPHSAPGPGPKPEPNPDATPASPGKAPGGNAPG
jgi:mono/diheme cytochrome c family protein